MRLCPVCGVAASHNAQGGPCLACYRAGVARMVDAGPYRALIARLCATGWTMSDIADAVGCSRQTVANIRTRRTQHLRPDLADALDALSEQLTDGCAVCDDVTTAAASSSDPNVIAARVGKSVAAVQKHLYRCGQPQLARMFHRHHHREEAHT